MLSNLSSTTLNPIVFCGVSAIIHSEKHHNMEVIFMHIQSDPQKKTPIITQMGIFAVILFVSYCLSNLFPATFPVPAPVIGLLILYFLLTIGLIKPQQIETLSNFFDQLTGLSLCSIGNSVSHFSGYYEAQWLTTGGNDYYFHRCYVSFGSAGCHRLNLVTTTILPN